MNPKHKAQASSSCMPKESQPRKNAYDTYFPLMFAFTFKVKFDWVKKKKLPHLFWGEIKNKKKKTCLPHLFLQKVAWESNTFFFLA